MEYVVSLSCPTCGVELGTCLSAINRPGHKPCPRCHEEQMRELRAKIAARRPTA